MSLSGVMKFITNNEMMVMYRILKRAMQGMFKTFIQTSSFVMLIITNSREKMKYIGLGSAIGPLIGAIVYSFFGFIWMFIVVSCMFLSVYHS